MLLERFRPVNPKLDCFDVFSEAHRRNSIENILLSIIVILFVIVVTIIVTMCSTQNKTTQRIWS